MGFALGADSFLALQNVYRFLSAGKLKQLHESWVVEVCLTLNR